MKGFASGLLFLSSLIGFTSPWGMRRSIPEQPVPVVPENIVVVDEVTINNESVPTAITVNNTQELHELIEEKLSTDLLQEVALYSDFRLLNHGDQLNFEYEETVLSRITIQQNDYERLRVELLPEPTVMLDTFPLDAKSIVMTFSKKDLFEPGEEFLDVIDAEPG